MCVYRLPELLAAMAEQAAAEQSGIPDIPAQSTGGEDVAGALVPHTGHELRQVSRSPG
jgi:hypothetical protein